MKTTLNKIREHEPCKSGWEKLLTYLGKTKSDDEPLEITTILDSNGLDDALWCLRAVEGHAKEIKLYAVWCARQVQHLLKDQRSLYALDVAERYANGQATKGKLTDAWYAAKSAAWDAKSAAWDAKSAAWAAEAAVWAVWSAAYAARDPAYRAPWAAAYAVDAMRSNWSVEIVGDKEMRKIQEAELRRICEEG